MANALIDFGVIARMGATLLETLSSTIHIVHMGEAEPSEEIVWARMSGIIFETIERHRSTAVNEPDTASVTFQIDVAVGPDNTGSFGIGTACSRVRSAFADQTTIDPNNEATFEHKLEILKTTVAIAADPDEERHNRFATVMIYGRAERRSGTSIESH